jgi:hypothetical protein
MDGPMVLPSHPSYRKSTDDLAKRDQAEAYKSRSAWHTFKHEFFKNEGKSFIPTLVKWLFPSMVPAHLRGGLRPAGKDFLSAARGAYKANPEKLEIPGFKIVYETPSFAAWLNDNTKTILLGIRGTKEGKDFAAWAPSALNVLGKTSRFKETMEDFKNMITNYSPNEYEYYAAGHSLGGGLINLLVRKYPNIIKGAITFNSSAEPVDFAYPNDDIITRYYVSSDPLYRSFGRFFKKAIIIKKSSPLYFRIASYFPGVASFLVQGPHSLESHELKNFEGMGKSRCKKCGGYK